MEWLWQLLIGILIGALVGWIAGLIMKSKHGFWGNAIIGILGGALGGWLGGKIGIGGGWLFSIIIAIACSCLLIWIAKKIFK